MDKDAEIDKVVHQLLEDHKGDPNIQSIGIADDTIVIYTVRTTTGYPIEYKGYKVRVSKVGRISASPKTDWR